ncbi:hypothetical protein [Pseudomonas sp. ADPe]|uniref:hypothetical protein n=1 Tax=unclassified Pseudomonas TaxID=196821 RepID=UPI0013663125|nr:hypothetical protein [Pseudomonas sp. ADPe]
MKLPIAIACTAYVATFAVSAAPANCGGLRTSSLSILTSACKYEMAKTRPLSRSGNCAQLQDEAYRVAAEIQEKGLNCSGQDLRDTQTNLRQASDAVDAAISHGFEP